MSRYRLDLSYHGAAFSGWQVQARATTVQGELQKALAIFFKQNIKVTGAGRTDAGVHAHHQVAHFDCPLDFDLLKCFKALNALTLDKLSILKLSPTSSDFHARYSPHCKTYLYKFDTAPQADPLTLDFFHHVHASQIDFDSMEKFITSIEGIHDFKNFCSVENNTSTTIRSIKKTQLQTLNDLKFLIRIQGKGFLQHMIRIIAGTAYHIAIAKIPLELALSALQGKQKRELLGPTLPAKGLTLESVDYDE